MIQLATPRFPDDLCIVQVVMDQATHSESSPLRQFGEPEWTSNKQIILAYQIHPNPLANPRICVRKPHQILSDQPRS
ncbi:MAG: hypothetical protein HQ518_15065 [Rhodopirellula sp.]|nr:hypothetical protein [Rhodopirellula sp.]